MNKRHQYKNNTYMRIDKELLEMIAEMRLPNKKRSRKIESYADVIRRLLKKHWAEMMKEKEEVLK